MDRHRDVEQVFAYTGPTPKESGTFAEFVQLFVDRETGALALVLRASDLRFVSVDVPPDAARELGHALIAKADGLHRVTQGAAA